MSIKITLGDYDVQELLEEADTMALVRALDERKYDAIGNYYTMTVKECIANLKYFDCPPEIIKALTEWNQIPVVDNSKLKWWAGKA